MPWERKYDEAEVLERAMHAFWARGYEATSMADLVAATGINRGSIYAAFADKRGLFVRALRHYDRTRRAEFLDRLAARHGPRQAILATFAAAAGPPGDAPPGCLMVNTALELSPHDPEIGAVVRESLDAVRAFFEDRTAAAQRAGAVPPGRDPAATAAALLGLFLGLRVLARSGADRAARNAVLAEAERMLG